MIFDFSKEYIGTYYDSEHGILKQCRKFEVSENNDLIGSFFYHSDICRFSFKETDIRIDIKKNIFKESKYTIIDNKTNRELGFYNLSNWVGFREVTGNLILAPENTYKCTLLKPDVKYSILKKETWGHYKIQVANDTEVITYRFRISLPVISGTDKLRPFKGTIESTNRNLLVLFLGLFWVEYILEVSDIS